MYQTSNIISTSFSNFFVAATVLVVIGTRFGVEAMGIPIATGSACKAFDHQRVLEVDGCESLMIPDRMCRGLCSSEVRPNFKNSQDRGVEGSAKNKDSIKVGEHQASTYPDGDVDSSNGGVKKAGDKEENEVTIELKGEAENQCLMCLPTHYEKKKFTLKCRRERQRQGFFSSERNSDLKLKGKGKEPPVWFFGSSGGADNDDEESLYELREEEVYILQDCQCQQVNKCTPWTNPSVTRDDDSDSSKTSNGEDK